jgi:hypothetical protein
MGFFKAVLYGWLAIFLFVFEVFAVPIVVGVTYCWIKGNPEAFWTGFLGSLLGEGVVYLFFSKSS